jgi:uncharacterized membrane protein
MMGFGLLWIVVIVIGFLFFAWRGFDLQSLTGAKQVNRSENINTSAMDILKQRYARGEITGDQYQTMKQDLI